jgi:hemoglobin-like flavoprotein
MLDIMVSHLSCLGKITSTIEEVAIRHIGYSVLPHDYDTVGMSPAPACDLDCAVQFSP